MHNYRLGRVAGPADHDERTDARPDRAHDEASQGRARAAQQAPPQLASMSPRMHRGGPGLSDAQRSRYSDAMHAASAGESQANKRSYAESADSDDTAYRGTGHRRLLRAPGSASPAFAHLRGRVDERPHGAYPSAYEASPRLPRARMTHGEAPASPRAVGRMQARPGAGPLGLLPYPHGGSEAVRWEHSPFSQSSDGRAGGYDTTPDPYETERRRAVWHARAEALPDARASGQTPLASPASARPASRLHVSATTNAYLSHGHEHVPSMYRAAGEAAYGAGYDGALRISPVTWLNTQKIRPVVGPQILQAKGVTELGVHRQGAFSGSTASVHLLVNRTGHRFVGKEVRAAGPQGENELMHETEGARRAVRAGAHPNLCEHYGVANVRFPGGETRQVYVQEYVAGDDGIRLKDKLHRHLPQLPRAERWQAIMLYARDLIRAVEHLERAQVVHSDIKPGNQITERGTGVTKLIDFGGWTMAGGPANMSTPGYAPPESKELEWRTAADHGISATMDGRSDMFSVGVVLDEMVQNVNVVDLDPHHRGLPAYLTGPSNADRVRDFIDLVSNLQDRYKENRMGAADALRHPFFRGLDSAGARRTLIDVTRVR